MTQPMGGMPYSIGPDGRPMMPSTVQQGTGGPLSPPGLPMMPQGLMVPRAGDSMGLIGGMVSGMVPQVGGDAAMTAIVQQQIYRSYYEHGRTQMTGGGIEQSFRDMQESMSKIAETISDAAAEIAQAVRSQASTGGGPAPARRPRSGFAPTTSGKGSAPKTRRPRIPKPVDAPEDEDAAGVSGGAVPPLPGRKNRQPQPQKPIDTGSKITEYSLASTPVGLAFASFSVGEVARRAAGKAAQRIQDQRASSGWERAPDGSWTRSGGAGAGRYVEKAQPGLGKVLDASTNGIQALSRISQGTPLGAALPGLGRFLGPAAFAVGGATWATQQLESQRYSNLAYQQITGGPNFSLTDEKSGFRQRVGETVFRAGQIGAMNGQDARMLYLGATATGLQGDQRQSALDFAVKEFRRTGADVADSLNLIQMTVRNGVTEFGSLSTALDKVSKTARETGQNVQVAQRAFAATLGNVQQNVTGTAAAATIAGGIQEQITKQGQTLAGQLDFSGMLSQPALMMQAQRVGQDPMAYMARIQQDPGLLGQGLQSQIDRVRDAVFDAPALQFANDEAKKAMALTGGKLTPGDAADIGRQMSERGMLNPMQFMQVARSMGMGGVTPANVYEVAAKVAVGGFRFDQSLAKGPNAALPDGGRTAAGHGIVRVGDQYEGKDARIGEQNKAIARDLGFKGSEEMSQAGNAYLKRIHGTGDARGNVVDPGTGARSGIVEGLLKDEKGLKDQRFIVQTKDGSKSVSFEEAFKNYQDQLARGDVVVEGRGETVAQITGQIGDRSVATPSSGQGAPKGASDPGGSSVKGAITVYADDELKRIIRMVATGGASLEQSRRQGVPAPAFPATPNDYTRATGD